MSAIDFRMAFSKGYDEGQKTILRSLRYILDDAPTPGYSALTNYYKHSIEIILEVYGYGKEKKEEN